ncbi:MAG: hypothetical protein BroJett024_43160 [Alphaproteobacteria bacterium]|nr:MAG: hypothetical protein BroJett024_43160 [Alphaproteobacteria bacterium]
MVYGAGVSTDSPVLDAFAAGAAAAHPDHGEAIHREAESSVVTREEMDLLVRALTAASRAASKAAKEIPLRSRLISDEDEAFIEATSFKPVAGPDVQRVLAAFGELMHLAAAELGPLPGGGVGQVKPPIGPTPTVEAVEPTPAMRQELAGRAGKVVGMAGALGTTDVVAEIRAFNDGCPLCGAPVTLAGGKHQQIAPETGPAFESGRCEVGHKLDRPEETVGQWRAVGGDELWGGDPASCGS